MTSSHVDSAIANVSKWFDLSKDQVLNIFNKSRLATEFNEVQTFFAFRSLANNINVSGKTFINMPSSMKEELILSYIDFHSFIGHHWITYSDVGKTIEKGRSSNKSIRVLTGTYLGSNALFPFSKKPTFEETLDALIASYWIANVTPTLSEIDRYRSVKESLGVSTGSVKWRLLQNFRGDISQNMTIASYFPRLYKMKWGDYIDLPLLPPLPCVSPYGFDILALTYLNYSVFTEPVELWGKQ